MRSAVPGVPKTARTEAHIYGHFGHSGLRVAGAIEVSTDNLIFRVDAKAGGGDALGDNHVLYRDRHPAERPRIFAARDPSSCEYLKTPSRSKRVRSMNSNNDSKAPCVSPGNPTMNVVRRATPGIPARREPIKGLIVLMRAPTRRARVCAIGLAAPSEDQ